MNAPGQGSIVIVDDDSGICHLFADVLQMEGFQVRAYFSPRKALAELGEAQLPDVIFVDSMMNEMSGGDFLTALRERFPDISRRTRLVGFSSGTRGSVLTASLEKLVDDFSEKPLDLDVLISLVQRQVELSRAARA